MRRFMALLGATCAICSAAQANIIFQDDFESYNSTGDMYAAGAWGANGAGQTGSLALAGGNPGQYMAALGGKSGQHTLAPGSADLSNGDIIWEFDIIDDGVGNKRMTGALRGSGTNNWWEMGRYNAMAHPESGKDGGSLATQVDGYGIRTVFNSGATVPPSTIASGGWVAFNNPSTNQPVLATAGTHHMRATISTTGVLFEIDLHNNGSIDGIREMTTADMSAFPFVMARLGAPSDLSSAGGGVGYDNLSLTQVPEPASLMLVSFGALALRRRR